MFKNREEAGQLLFKELLQYKDHNSAVIVSIPRGGVPVGFELSKKLNLPLDIVLTKKIGHPINKEYSIGAITLENIILSNAAKRVSDDYISSETKKIRAILNERYKRYYGSTKPINLKDKIVIIIDDGVATGNTLLSSIQLIQQQKPSKIIVALPVASKSALKRLREFILIENTICLYAPESFQAVGQFYKEFEQIDDAEVIALMKKANEKYALKNIA